MTTAIQINLSVEIAAAYTQATSLADTAKGQASLAVQKAIECGQLLMRQKETIGHGGWLEWLEFNVPQIAEKTAQNYMRLAKSATELAQLPENQENHPQAIADLSTTTLKSAYVALGIMPSSEPKTEQAPDPNKGWVQHLRHIDGFRLWFNRRTDGDPLQNWSPDARRVLMKDLRWIAELYATLRSMVDEDMDAADGEA